MIERLDLSLENCYGIGKLDFNFDFTRTRPDQSIEKAFSVYAPNGSMKSTLARTIQDYLSGEETSDHYYPDRQCKREIKDKNGNEFPVEALFVIKSEIDTEKSKRISDLLVNETLKAEYDTILAGIEDAQKPLFEKLKQLSGLTGRGNQLEAQMLKAFGNGSMPANKDSIANLLVEIEDLVDGTTTPKFAHITFDEVFNSKTEPFLRTKDFKTRIEKYIEIFDRLVEQSSFLRKGFNHTNAVNIHKNLSSEGFFSAEHSVNLKNRTTSEKVECSDPQTLHGIIEQELSAVYENAELKAKFKDIDDALNKNQELRRFRDYLHSQREIAVKLSDLDAFSKEIWLDYLVEHFNLYAAAVKTIKDSRERLHEIVEQAKTESETWRRVVAEFKRRFHVPFNLEVINQENVILHEAAPTLRFIIDREVDDKREIEESLLHKCLSQGERRAYYILNILFEIESRKRQEQDTVFIIDDIADSFDYKNKYAIVQYLYEVSKAPNFYLVILTHNFDFHRTITSRLSIGRKNCLTVLKNANELTLVEEFYQKNPFLHWMKNLSTNPTMAMAAITFVRNLAEFGNRKSEFEYLTSLVHMKSDTESISIENLQELFGDVLSIEDLSMPSPERPVLEVIKESAETLLGKDDSKINLEGKIVLAMAIRLHAERFILSKISDPSIVNTISSNQTFQLANLFQNEFSAETEKIDILNLVQLMTPEQIHVNSFMYEPILDMSSESLKELYKSVRDNLH
jgi:hypothetical protein